MYLWKIEKLKEDIKENKVTKKDENLYLIFFTLLYVGLFVQALIQVEILWNIEMLLIQMFIAIGGVFYGFRKNSGAKDFIKNFSAIGWVFLLRSLFFMSLGMLNLYVMTHLFGLAELLTAKNAIIVGMAFELLLYWRIGAHIESLKS